MSATAPRTHRSIWRPWPALVVHAAVVVVTIAAAVVVAVLPVPAVAEGVIAPVASVAWTVVVSLYLLALHWSVVAAARRDGRERTPVPDASAEVSVPTPDAAPPAGPAVIAVALGIGAGAVCWAGWLAVPDAPGTALAYTGAITTALVAAVALARITRSTGAPLGVSAGLWLAHAVWLFRQDSALWAFAALLALPVAAAVGALATTFSFATGLTGARSPTAPPPPPVTGWVFSSRSSSDRPGAPTSTGSIDQGLPR